jgi:UDP-N-acetyl-2-amino-2-deoxyglucuronate dehydrogenase
MDGLEAVEKETDSKVFNILQLRLHPAILDLRKKILSEPAAKIHDIDLTYISSRGNWYYSSWKGDESKSGGIATNIGIHFFDMLVWIFGKVKTNIVHIQTHDRASGFLELERARVRWFLSINQETLPDSVLSKGKNIYRSLTLEGNEIEFSEGFVDLHTQSYSEILEGRGFGLEAARSSVELVHDIRLQKGVGLVGDYHPFSKKPLADHPFH